MAVKYFYKLIINFSQLLLNRFPDKTSGKKKIAEECQPTQYDFFSNLIEGWD
jgi:hypothetical protein